MTKNEFKQQPAIAAPAVQVLTGSDTVDKAKTTADILAMKTAIDLIRTALAQYGIISS